MHILCKSSLIDHSIWNRYLIFFWIHGNLVSISLMASSRKEPTSSSHKYITYLLSVLVVLINIQSIECLTLNWSNFFLFCILVVFIFYQVTTQTDFCYIFSNKCKTEWIQLFELFFHFSGCLMRRLSFLIGIFVSLLYFLSMSFSSTVLLYLLKMNLTSIFAGGWGRVARSEWLTILCLCYWTQGEQQQ